MREHSIAAAILLLPALGSAQEFHFSRWNAPGGLHRRQTPPPGYHPEFGSCGSGTTCENACGQNWISCQASTSLSLFCYNKVDLGQSCCENGSGRACERGYYCAWNEFGGQVWCCEDGQSLEECGVTSPSSASSNSPSSTSSSESSTSATSATAGTGTLSESEPASTNTGQCPAQNATVTSWATTTVISTVFAVTVTAPGEGCSSTSQSSTPDTYLPSTVTEPPSSTSLTPPVFNTTTSSLVTGSARILRVDFWAMVIGMGMMWL